MALPSHTEEPTGETAEWNYLCLGCKKRGCVWKHSVMFSYQRQVHTYVLEKYHLLGWQTVTGLGHRLLLWDESLLAFFWVTGTICPSSWGKAGWSEWSPGILFSFLFGIPDLASVTVWRGGWLEMTCLVPRSAVKPGHNLLWLTYCIAGGMFGCKADGFKMNVFAISTSYSVRCCLFLSPLLVQNLQ